jgi:hypothetical protein
VIIDFHIHSAAPNMSITGRLPDLCRRPNVYLKIFGLPAYSPDSPIRVIRDFLTGER